MENNPESAVMHFSTPEAEITYLREQISNKEKELNDKKQNYEINQVVEDQISRYKEVPIEHALHKDLVLPKESVEAIVLDLIPERHDDKIVGLLDILNEKGIKNAMSVLAGFKDPHIEDDFHRFLVQYIKKGYKAKDVDVSNREFRGLNMTLYEVVLPEEKQDEKTKSLKELISGMEQFLSGMLSIVAKDSTKSYKENYFVLEIANANGSDQFVFYVAVPNMHKELFERQLISVFHHARLAEVTSDYNIFNNEGASLGSYLESSTNSVYPFKTYEAFDHDPLNIILNSFSKIQKEGEGAAIQIIFAPKGDYYNKKYNFAIEQIEKGIPTKEAIDLPETVSGTLKKGVFSLFKSGPKPDEEKKPIDSDAIQKIKLKTSATIVSTNIRLVASAPSQPDAERILQGLESSFNQFTDTASNGLKIKRLEKAALASMLRNFSFRAYDSEQNLPLNLHEVTTLIHFHTNALAPTPQLKQSQSVAAPAPSEISKTGTLLGINTYRNVDTPIYMQDEDRLRHLYTIGQTGTGKTTLLKNMIIQDINSGQGACFIDPHGSDVLDILSNIPQNRFQDVIYFDPSHTERPMALNMLEYDRTHPEQKTFVVNELFSIFQKLYGGVPESLGPMFEQYFRNATMLVIEDPDSGCTLLDVSRVMTNKEFRQMKLANCKNPVVYQFWTEVAEKAGGEASLANIVPYITSKFDVFLANDIMRPIIAQEKSSFDFRKIMDQKKILLVNLSKGRLGDINANLIGLILVGKILMAALSRVDVINQTFPPFYLYIDEFQNITTNSIATILSEARKYKLSLNIAHQFIAQLQDDIKDAVFGNVGSIAAFRVGAEDAEYLEKQFSPVFTAKDIMNIDNYNAYLKMLVGGKPVKAFNIKASTPPKGNPEVIDKLKQLSYLTYGGNREEIEADILKKYKK
ncbi:type IV secretory system conjugative DNA transfer family protein [Patescibacteria group bacterium]|nr:type IV secretory system conjugative DNA transfer family protein [Patescibacteria group bacterium]